METNLISQLKLYLLNNPSLNQKICTSPEIYEWFKSQQKSAPMPIPKPTPPPPAPLPRPQPKIAPQPPVKPAEPVALKQGFKLNPRKESQDAGSKSLLDQLKTSAEGVTFFEKPSIPEKKKSLLVCSPQEKEQYGSLLEKLAAAIDQKILSCSVAFEPIDDYLIIATPGMPIPALATLPNLEELQNNPAIKLQIWKELKECLSKSC